MNMQLTPLSSNVHAYGYDEEKYIFRVEFNNGSVYDYYDVPAFLYVQAEECSIGTFLAQNIKGQYRYQKIN